MFFIPNMNLSALQIYATWKRNSEFSCMSHVCKIMKLLWCVVAVVLYYITLSLFSFTVLLDMRPL